MTGYYRKFVKYYGSIAAPLTGILRKNSFILIPASLHALGELKAALTSTPVLALPDFSQPFVVECDASDLGFGAVLQQLEWPIAFFSQALAQRHQKLPAYEHELIGLTKDVRHWHAYFWGQSFVVRTDHYNLNYLLEPRLSTPAQQHWVATFCSIFVLSIKRDAQTL